MSTENAIEIPSGSEIKNQTHPDGVASSSTATDQADAISITLLNMNSYASKKTFAQGMLDLALLAANASQLKYILTNWDMHEFHTLLLCLVVASICLQVLQAVVCIVLALVFDINQVDHQKSAEIINNVSLSIVVVVVVINVVISAFDIKSLGASTKA